MGKKNKARKNVQKKKSAYRDPAGGAKNNKLKRLEKRAAAVTSSAAYPDHVNPFEVRVNRRKHETLGRLAKHEKGLPGVSRARSIEIRNATLLEDYKMRNKTNLFKDKRFGEKNRNLTEEDKMLKRTAIEKARQYKKRSIFNLPEEEFQLTHKGQPLSTIDRYEDDPRDSNSDSDAERLDEKFVGEMNFSGFLKKKSITQEEEVEEEKSREQRISELILESKKRKHEKMVSKDENYSLVQSLDEQFKSSEFRQALVKLHNPTKSRLKKLSESELELELEKLSENPPVKETPIPEPPKQIEIPESHTELDYYDKLVREIQFDKGGRPVIEGGKTQEEREVEKSLFSSLLNEKLSKEFIASENNILKLMREVDGVCPKLREIALAFPLESAKVFLDKLTRYQKTFTKGKKLTMQMIILARISVHLYPGSEIRHLVQTPMNIFILQLINKTKIISIQRAIQVLLLCETIYNITKDSKRYCSEPLNFLASNLLCFCPKGSKLVNLLLSPKVRPLIEFLRIEKSKQIASQDIPQNLSSLLEVPENSDKFRLGFLLMSLRLLERFTDLYREHLSAREIFIHFDEIFQELRTKSWPEAITGKIDEIKGIIEGTWEREREPLKVNAERPKILKLYEPLIEEGFDGNKRRSGNKEKKEQSRLLHHVKKEFKSAVREIKKDNVFLAKHQLKEQMNRDAERKRKVNEIMGSLANQEGDYKKSKRRK